MLRVEHIVQDSQRDVMDNSIIEACYDGYTTALHGTLADMTIYLPNNATRGNASEER